MQQDRKPRNKPMQIYGQLIFNKGSKNAQLGKRQFIQQMVLGKLDIHMQQTDTRLLS